MRSFGTRSRNQMFAFLSTRHHARRFERAATLTSHGFAFVLDQIRRPSLRPSTNETSRSSTRTCARPERVVSRNCACRIRFLGLGVLARRDDGRGPRATVPSWHLRVSLAPSAVALSGSSEIWSGRPFSIRAIADGASHLHSADLQCFGVHFEVKLAPQEPLRPAGCDVPLYELSAASASFPDWLAQRAWPFMSS